jgi:hypothetical protein
MWTLLQHAGRRSRRAELFRWRVQLHLRGGSGNCTLPAAPALDDGCEATFGAPAACGTSCVNKVDCNVAVQHASGITCATNTCGYTACTPNYYDCNGNAADGCEVPQHYDGLGDYFTDCGVAVGTYTLALAQEAANAWDSTGTISNGSTTYSGSLQYWVCDNSTVKNRSACWTYNATGTQVNQIGQIFLSSYNGYWLPGSGSSHGTQYSWN